MTPRRFNPATVCGQYIFRTNPKRRSRRNAWNDMLARLMREAKERFPVGTRCVCVFADHSGRTYTVIHKAPRMVRGDYGMVDANAPAVGCVWLRRDDGREMTINVANLRKMV